MIEALADLYASTGATEKLRRLTREAQETQDDDLAITIASSLSSAGLHSEADGILLLALRKSKSDVARFHLLAPALELTLGSKEFDRVERFLPTLCECDPRESNPEFRRILDAIRESASGALGARLEKFFAEQQARRSHRAVPSLCRLELAMAAEADEETLAEVSKSLDQFDVRAEELAIGVDRCLDRGEHSTANSLMTMIGRRNQSVGTFAPQKIRLSFATGDSAAADELFRKLLFHHSDGFIGPQLQTEIAEAFSKAGDNHRASVIYEHFRVHLQNPANPSNAFLESYLRFLFQKRDFNKAREVFREACRKSPPPDMGLLVDLYEEWGRIKELPGSIPAFDLTSGSIADLEQILASKQAKKDSLSDPPAPD